MIRVIHRLSGLSPFVGDSDIDTYENIRHANYNFDDQAFSNMSQMAKDFIANLLVQQKENRFTAIQCLASSWMLTEQINDNIPLCTDNLEEFIVRRKMEVCSFAMYYYASVPNRQRFFPFLHFI